ncbi:MAG TPA: FliH/SctL family protein [Candidatus Kapabacteria bacterium]|nr:FliH/SctL family protein [Candidatus Kapabacteria bacterium]
MSEIILRLPRRRNKVKIISNPDNLETIIKRNVVQELESNVIPEVELEPQDEIKVECKETKTQFIHKFIINDKQAPVQIDLSKLPKPTILIEEAKLEIQSAYDHGFKDGQDATIAIYENEILHLKDRMLSIENVIDALKQSYIKEIRKFEDKLIKTSILVAATIIAKEVQSDKNIIINTIKRSLDELQDEKIFQIHISPNDYDTLLKIKSKLFTNQAMANSVELISDSQIDEGGALIFSSAGTIDARINTQLKKIQEILVQSLVISDGNDFSTLQNELNEEQ